MRERGIFGLVLAGGIYPEMEMPTGDLTYHDRPQWAYSTQLLAPYCDQIWISVDETDRLPDVPDAMIMKDNGENNSPLTGIVTALSQYPDNPFIVMACNKPGIDRTVMNRLMRGRDPEKRMSCFTHDELIDPWVAFWEPGVLSKLENIIRSSGSLYSFAKKDECNLIELEAIHWEKLKSIRTPEERKEFLRLYKPGKDSFEIIN